MAAKVVIPTLAQVLAAGNNAQGQDIVGLVNVEASGDVNVGNLSTGGYVEIHGPTDLHGYDLDMHGGAIRRSLLPDLPTADPGDAGALWNDAGTLKVSLGPSL